MSVRHLDMSVCFMVSDSWFFTHMLITYTLFTHMLITHMVFHSNVKKKFPLYKINVTKNALFFLLQVPTHHSFTFNS